MTDSKTKKIICLANSWRMGGVFVAGKVVADDGSYGEWVRPISERPTEEIAKKEIGGELNLLDIVEIPTLKKTEPPAHAYQKENVLIGNSQWANIKKASYSDAQNAVDVMDGALWVNGSDSFAGENDRIPEKEANNLEHSLCLIQADRFSVQQMVSDEGKIKYRALFFFNGEKYNLAITDSTIPRRADNMEIVTEDAILCVSLGGLFNGFAYKMVAGIITPA